MRDRLRHRTMARRPGVDRRIELSPRARLLGGWLAALLLVLVVAAMVRVVGGGDGAGSVASPTASGGLVAIHFGTVLGEDRLVPPDARTARFVAEDTFAYSVGDAPPATAVYVEVRRTAGGEVAIVQAPAEAQPVPGSPGPIGFSVPATALFEAWGPGTYEMRIYLDPQGAPIASGAFELVEPPSAVPTNRSSE